MNISKNEITKYIKTKNVYGYANPRNIKCTNKQKYLKKHNIKNTEVYR